MAGGSIRPYDSVEPTEPQLRGQFSAVFKILSCRTAGVWERQRGSFPWSKRTRLCWCIPGPLEYLQQQRFGHVLVGSRYILNADRAYLLVRLLAMGLCAWRVRAVSDSIPTRKSSGLLQGIQWQCPTNSGPISGSLFEGFCYSGSI